MKERREKCRKEKKRSAVTNIENVDERILENSKDVVHEVAKAHGLRIDKNKKKKSKRNS